MRKFKAVWIDASKRVPCLHKLYRVKDRENKNRVAYFDGMQFLIADQPLEVVAWKQSFINEKGRKL